MGPGCGRGEVPAGWGVREFQSQTTPGWPPAPPQLAHLGGWGEGPLLGGSVGDDPKSGALLMVPMVSSGGSSSWQEGQGTQPSC